VLLCPFLPLPLLQPGPEVPPRAKKWRAYTSSGWPRNVASSSLLYVPAQALSPPPLLPVALGLSQRQSLTVPSAPPQGGGMRESAAHKTYEA
jgi:hypothetical protein